MLNGAMYVSCPVLFRQPNPNSSPTPKKTPNPHLFAPSLALASHAALTMESLRCHRRCPACTHASSVSHPFLLKKVDLLLLALRLQVLVGAEGQRAADQDDGVQANARRGAVGGRGGGAGLCVALGLGVALLYRVVSLLSFSVVGIGLWGWLGVRFGYVWMYV